MTTARIDILRTLHDSELPLTAQEVFEANEHSRQTDRVTVYRTLNALVDAKIAHKVDPGDRLWRYGLIAQDHGQHAHFVCDACGEIRCLEEAIITVSLKGKTAPNVFKVNQQDVYLHGTCETCLEAPSAKPAKKKPRGRSSRDA